MTPVEGVVRALEKLPANTRIAVAVSGGADSMALLYAVASALGAGAFSAAPGNTCDLSCFHFNHNLRSADEHSADLKCVRGLCDRVGIALVTGEAFPGEIRDAARSEKSGVEAAARVERYRFFGEAADATGVDEIWTAHTQDDQVESIVMALQRGADGLFWSGIPETRLLCGGVRVRRPLLHTSREEVVALLRANRVVWSEDASNADDEYARNRLRNTGIPEMGAAVPGFTDAVLRIGEAARIRRQRAEGERAAAGDRAWFDGGVMGRGAWDALSRDARVLCLLEEARSRGMLRAASRIPVRFFDPLPGLGAGECGTVEGRGQRIEAGRDAVRWSAAVVRGFENGYLRQVTFGVAVKLPRGRVLTILPGKKETTDTQAIVIEFNQVFEPLVIRSSRAGDVIRTAGGAKAVGDLFGEQRVPAPDRKLIPVIVDRAGIVAVLGQGFGTGRTVMRCPSTAEMAGGRACTVVLTGVN